MGAGTEFPACGGRITQGIRPMPHRWDYEGVKELEPMVGIEPTAFPIPTGCASVRATPACCEHPSWRRQQDSNLRPPGSKPGTLFAELWRRGDGAGERSRTSTSAVRERCSSVELRRPAVCGPERLRSSNLPLAGRALSWLSYGPRDGVAGTSQTCDLWLRRPALCSLSYGDVDGRVVWRAGVEPAPRASQARTLPLS
jgi:hypothetical protein